MGPPDLLPHARYLLAIFVSLRPVQVAKLLRPYLNHSCGVVRSAILFGDNLSPINVAFA